MKTASSDAALVLVAAQTVVSPLIDGKLDDRIWLSTPRTAPFVDPAEPSAVVAHTEVRAVWDDAALTLAFFAADEDVQSSDFVGVALRPLGDGAILRLEMPPKGPLRCQLAGVVGCAGLPGLRAAADFDGTLDDPADDDEEWGVELALPWSALDWQSPPREIELSFFRRDQPKGMPMRMLVWGNDPASAHALGWLKLGPGVSGIGD